MAGFILDLSQASADHDGKLETYSVDAAHATLLAPGDVVVITGESDAEGVAEVDAAAAAAPITGVIAGIEPVYQGEQLTQTGLPASVAGKVRVHMSPLLNFIVPVTGGALTAAQVGLNADIDATAAAQVGGMAQSNMAIDSGSAAVTATLPFRIVGLVPNSDGVIDGLTARVRFNATTTVPGAAGL